MRVNLRQPWVLVLTVGALSLVFTIGCPSTAGSDAGATQDASVPDAAGLSDASVMDASVTDASVVDAGPAPRSLADSVKPGSRLRAKWHRADGGASAFVGFFDSARNEDCLLRPTGDGGFLCTPFAESTITFLDSSCRTPMVSRFASCAASRAAPAMLAVEDRFAFDVCTARSTFDLRLYGNVVALDAGLLTYLLEDDGGCRASGFATGATDFAATTLIPGSAFVAFHVERRPRGQFVDEFGVADDGAEVLRGVSFADGGAVMRIDLGDAGARLLPTTSTYLYSGIERVHSSSTCAEPVALSRSCGGGADLVIELLPSDGCTIGNVLRRRGALVPGPGWTQRQAACRVTYEAPDDRLYRFGDVVPPTSLLPSVSVNLGKGALFVSYEGDDTGAPLQIGWEVWKTAAGRPCQLREFQGAGLRCEPLESLRFAPRYFEDVMCMRPLSEPLTPLCGALPEVLSESVVLPDTCVVERQYRPGAPYIGAVYERVGMACQALAMSPGMLLRLTPVAPGELPSASLVVE